MNALIPQHFPLMATVSSLFTTNQQKLALLFSDIFVRDVDGDQVQKLIHNINY